MAAGIVRAPTEKRQDRHRVPESTRMTPSPTPSEGEAMLRAALKEAISQLIPFAEDGDQPAISAAIDNGRKALNATHTAARSPLPGTREEVAIIKARDAYIEDWGSIIYDATGDQTKVDKAIELAHLNGMFDSLAPLPPAPMPE